MGKAFESEGSEYWVDDGEIGCVNCDGGWRHGCCDDLCRGSNDSEWCENAIPCRTCNPFGDVL